MSRAALIIELGGILSEFKQPLRRRFRRRAPIGHRLVEVGLGEYDIRLGILRVQLQAARKGPSGGAEASVSVGEVAERLVGEGISGVEGDHRLHVRQGPGHRLGRPGRREAAERHHRPGGDQLGRFLGC